MKYDSVLLISIDALSKKYAKYFYPYFNEYYPNYRTTNTWTLPSHFTMLTGKILPELYFCPKIKDALNYQSYLESIPTIASVFKKLNFKTKAIIGGGFLSNYFGWGKDWDEWIEAKDINDSWQGEEIKIEKNSFIFLHTYYVHNWFEDHYKLNSLFTIRRKELDELKKFPKKLIYEGKDYYLKRIKFIAKKLNWLNKLDKKILVILTSDHGELFFENGKAFHHGNFALQNPDIFETPLLIRSNEGKKIIKETIYDFYLPLLILKKIEANKDIIHQFLTIRKNDLKTNLLIKKNQNIKNQLQQAQKKLEKLETLIKENQILQNQIQQTKTHIQNLEATLNKIKSAKFFKLWQGYCKLRDKILTFVKNEKTEKTK